MNPEFSALTSGLDPAFRRLMEEKPQKPLKLAAPPEAGVYVLSEAAKHLYVGRSNRLKKRLSNHCREGATERMAAFAFRLAREATGLTKATYRPEGSRKELMKNPAFMRAFEKAKARIRAMDVRLVEEPHPIRQCLLEVYVAVSLGTPYNDFDTH